MVSLGSLGGVVATNIFLTKDAPRYTPGTSMWKRPPGFCLDLIHYFFIRSRCDDGISRIAVTSRAGDYTLFPLSKYALKARQERANRRPGRILLYALGFWLFLMLTFVSLITAMIYNALDRQKLNCILFLTHMNVSRKLKIRQVSIEITIDRI